MRYAKGQRFMHIRAESGGTKTKPNPPVFSEDFLYKKVGKDDARFILGVAEEYETIIQRLGTDKVWEILSTEEQRERGKSAAANALYSARRALNEAAASLCENCKKGKRTDGYNPNKVYGVIEHEVPNPAYVRGQDEWAKAVMFVPCKAQAQREALDSITRAIREGAILGIDTEPAPHPFVPATHPPVSWCEDCWLDAREDFHDEDRIAEAAKWKQ